MDSLSFNRIRRRLGLSQLRVAQGARLPLYKVQRFEQGIMSLEDFELRAIQRALKKAARDRVREANCFSADLLDDEWGPK